MTKKFDKSPINDFFTEFAKTENNTSNTDSTHDKSNTQNKPNKPGRPPKPENEKLRGYRYNLNLDKDLKQYLHERAWQKRTSITQYINDLIRADMEKYFDEGGTKEGWLEDE